MIVLVTLFIYCLTGPRPEPFCTETGLCEVYPLPVPCGTYIDCVDLDTDNDIDLFDYAILQESYDNP